MKLQDFLGQDTKYDVNAIAADAELSRQIQVRLIDLGLLNPPADGRFGPISTAALKRFQELTQCEEPGFLGAKTAKRLIETKREALPGVSPVLQIVTDTILKAKPIPSSELVEQEKQGVKAGSVFELVSFDVVRNHVRVTLKKEAIGGSKIWYAFGQHVQILENGKLVYPKPKPKTVKLNVPYKLKLDSSTVPMTSAIYNITSIAMCLEFLGASRKTDKQFEDELYEYAINNNLNRHDPNDLARLVKAYGCQDIFKENATIEEVQDWLANGNPAVIHGFFTSFGHIMPVVGYDENGFFVHDPYGEWTPDGYRTDKSGAFLNYSYRLIRKLCIPDGNFWVHFISK